MKSTEHQLYTFCGVEEERDVEKEEREEGGGGGGRGRGGSQDGEQKYEWIMKHHTRDTKGGRWV